MFSISFFMLLSIFIIITINYVSNKLPPFHVALMENSLVFHLGSVSLSSHFGCFVFSTLDVKLISPETDQLLKLIKL